MNDTFTPKIVRWGQRFGQNTGKEGLCIKAYQKSSGKNNNSSSRSRSEGKTYRNPKLDSASRKTSFFTQTKGAKQNLRYQ